MANWANMPYTAGVTADGVSYQAVRLPYADRTVAMEILVPEQGQFEAFEAALDWSMLEAILGGMQRTELNLKMPRFTFRNSFSLAEQLKAMGMLDAFTPVAVDFSGMDGTRCLNIDSVIHQAFVAVDETGTEAAAATIVEIVTTSEAPEPEIIELTIDRPFFFLIRDLTSGQILFVGRVLDPTQQKKLTTKDTKEAQRSLRIIKIFLVAFVCTWRHVCTWRPLCVLGGLCENGFIDREQSNFGNCYRSVLFRHEEGSMNTNLLKWMAVVMLGGFAWQAARRFRRKPNPTRHA